MQVAYRLNLPLSLTLIRLVVAPILLPLLVYYLFPSNSFTMHVVLASICGIFCLTDFFDGYLARKYSQVTLLGKMLDPIADKFFICATLISLVAVHKIYFFWVIILIGRELYINGLRTFAASQNLSIPVNGLGKLKTTLQGIFLFVVILNPYKWMNVFSSYIWSSLEFGLLISTIVCSIYSAYKYTKSTLTILFHTH